MERVVALLELEQCGANVVEVKDLGGFEFGSSEVFVLLKGQWVNPGWHIDSGK